MVWNYRGPTSQPARDVEYHLSAEPGPAMALHDFLAALQPPIQVAHPLSVETVRVSSFVLRGVGFSNSVKTGFRRLQIRRRSGDGVFLDFKERGETLELALSQGGIRELKEGLQLLASGEGDFSVWDDGDLVSLTFWVPGRH